MSTSISIREQGSPDFSHSLRGYDREQVDEYISSLRDYTIQVEDRATAAESALLRCRRELVGTRDRRHLRAPRVDPPARERRGE